MTQPLSRTTIRRMIEPRHFLDVDQASSIALTDEGTLILDTPDASLAVDLEPDVRVWLLKRLAEIDGAE